MSGPSKTPWKVVPGTTSGCAIIAELEPKVRRNVASVGGQVREANARRIVAAVNGTSTLSTEALEAGAIDKLVEAASVAVEELDYIAEFAMRQTEWTGDDDAALLAVKNLRAALALARGEQA